jgi:hypothetical protein
MSLRKKCTKILMTMAVFMTPLAMAEAPFSIHEKVMQENNATMHYKIKVRYPQIEAPGDAAAQKLNEKILQMVNEKATRFRNNVKGNLSTVTNLPAGVQDNTFDVRYKIFLFQPKKWFSVLFNIETSFAGSAHPIHKHFSVNYDWANNRFLNLQNIFKPDSKYLEVISQYSKSALLKHFAMSNQQAYLQMVRKGTDVTKPENFKTWNISPKSLVITFEEYQVSPYYSGPQTVSIPYEVLREVIYPGLFK